MICEILDHEGNIIREIKVPVTIDPVTMTASLDIAPNDYQTMYHQLVVTGQWLLRFRTHVPHLPKEGA